MTLIVAVEQNGQGERCQAQIHGGELVKGGGWIKDHKWMRTPAWLGVNEPRRPGRCSTRTPSIERADLSAFQPYYLAKCQIIEFGKPAPHYLQSMPRERPSAWRGIAFLGAIKV